MKILLTGAGGFLGKNFLWAAKEAEEFEVLAYHHEMGEAALGSMCQDCDVVVHLAGVNRPETEQGFVDGNVAFTKKLVDFLEERSTPCPVMFSSSAQAERDNAYGRSKREAERILRNYAKKCGTSAMIYRLPNVFGKWSRPEYNSVVATFCHHIARGLPIRVDDPAAELQLVYVDDVVSAFLRALRGNGERNGDFYEATPIHSCTVGKLAELIKDFRDDRRTLGLPTLGDAFVQKLYSTYLSFLPADEFSYPLLSHTDARGAFTEFLRTDGQGQISVNLSYPHVVKGGHWHQSKHEKFLVVAGTGVIRLRKVGSEDVVTYDVSGEKLEVVEIPPGYTHEIENTGEMDMVTLMWVNENFDPEHPDTYRMEV